jgi:tRNA(Ile2) C34 agmatinyltransferase TiaS
MDGLTMQCRCGAEMINQGKQGRRFIFHCPKCGKTTTKKHLDVIDAAETDTQSMRIGDYVKK